MCSIFPIGVEPHLHRPATTDINAHLAQNIAAVLPLTPGIYPSRQVSPPAHNMSMQGPLFMGKQFSFVDAVFAPFLERMVASVAYYKGFYMRGTGEFPGIEAWFDSMEQRPAYLATRSDHYTHCHDLPPQLGGACTLLRGPVYPYTEQTIFADDNARVIP